MQSICNNTIEGYSCINAMKDATYRHRRTNKVFCEREVFGEKSYRVIIINVNSSFRRGSATKDLHAQNRGSYTLIRVVYPSNCSLFTDYLNDTFFSELVHLYSGRKITESIGNVTVKGKKYGKSKRGARLPTV
jgi:hypothetical protein